MSSYTQISVIENLSSEPGENLEENVSLLDRRFAYDKETYGVCVVGVKNLTLIRSKTMY